MHRISLIFVMLSLIFQAMAGVMGKQASLALESFSLSGVLHNPFYFGVLFCLGLQAVTWQLALRRFPLFYAYLFMSLIYPLLLVSSHFIFNEEITIANVIGSAVIIAGVVVLSTDAKKACPHD
ncbi:MAG: hypothetical protein PHU25_19790 [Deltaproteobacteria bacterium]|nr:hypothetical protein [Deltaproteobacteria bacterium]